MLVRVIELLQLLLKLSQEVVATRQLEANLASPSSRVSVEDGHLHPLHKSFHPTSGGFSVVQVWEVQVRRQ